MQVERRKELLTPKKKMAEKRLQSESDGEDDGRCIFLCVYIMFNYLNILYMCVCKIGICFLYEIHGMPQDLLGHLKASLGRSS